SSSRTFTSRSTARTPWACSGPSCCSSLSRKCAGCRQSINSWTAGKQSWRKSGRYCSRATFQGLSNSSLRALRSDIGAEDRNRRCHWRGGCGFAEFSQLIPLLQHLPQPPQPAREQRLRFEIETDFAGTATNAAFSWIRRVAGLLLRRQEVL